MHEGGVTGNADARSGCIVNVSSVSGRIANSPLGPHSASKFALEAITEVIAGEVKPFSIGWRWSSAKSSKVARGKVRHQGGHDAAAFIGWRAGMTDEQWVDSNAQDDEAWYDTVQRDFGLNAHA
jgi:NADP-dependent 3-hydroxy acid dehydrogenase YdfG